MTIEKNKNINKKIITLFSGQSSILTVPKLYVQLTGNHSLALVLNQCVFWSDKSSLKDGWFYKTYEDWFDELCIPERTLRRRFERLVENGWIITKTKMVKGINTLHIKPDMNKIIDSISTLLYEDRPIRPLCPEPVDNSQNTCTKVDPTGQLGRTESATLSGSSYITDEDLQMNKEQNLVFVSVDNVKNHLLNLLRTKNVTLSDDQVQQIIFYLNGVLDYKQVCRKINIALKFIREGKWQVPHGFKSGNRGDGVVRNVGATPETEAAYYRQKEEMYRQDTKAMQNIAERVLSETGKHALDSIRAMLNMGERHVN